MNHSPDRLFLERQKKLQWLLTNGASFPTHYERTHTSAQLQHSHEKDDKETLAQKNIMVAVCGRIMAKRGPFMSVQDGTGRIQIYTDKKIQAMIKECFQTWDIGDIIGAGGTLQRSNQGDLYILVETATMLNKSLRPLPEKYAGLTDTELRYRQRYVDLLMNEDTRRIFLIRSAMIQTIRDFFNQRQFIEVETPMLHPIAGGANARPFTTHHNALSQDMYLRIAPELYLKRLVVGGFERVYEINRNFRNEGISTRHNPEFTMLEFYQAYCDYNHLMTLTETLLPTICQSVLASTSFHYQGQAINMDTPFKCMTLQQAISTHCPTPDDMNALQRTAADHQLAPLPSKDKGKWQLHLFEKLVEPTLIQPTFITHYPTSVSPLARPDKDNPEVTERFELFIGGYEIANGFSELNDASEQAKRFRSQSALRASGDEESMFYDEDYISALEYGLPPTAGEGVGIDRLVMLLTNSPSIREVVLFPTLRSQ